MIANASRLARHIASTVPAGKKVIHFPQIRSGTGPAGVFFRCERNAGPRGSDQRKPPCPVRPSHPHSPPPWGGVVQITTHLCAKVPASGRRLTENGTLLRRGALFLEIRRFRHPERSEGSKPAVVTCGSRGSFAALRMTEQEGSGPEFPNPS